MLFATMLVTGGLLAPGAVNKCMTLDQAAIAAFQVAFPLSVKFEHAGVLYMRNDGCFLFTYPQTQHRQLMFKVKVRFRGVLAGVYHTHTQQADQAEKYSPTDQSTQKRLNVPSFLGVVKTHEIRRLCPNGNKRIDVPFLS